ncbi:MAG: hypothetical protein HLUCCO02_05945 [Idiomarinaceae bacterium HL-53]|nr:MAG: hypothetical protein HLUCCO02_05945 [Idiomarinaceae bacterium HL-53]CUS48096.1 Uncharacterized conserved protein YdiU, UPF0061 family [Idiomarinaceae bacterium HL-53]
MFTRTQFQTLPEFFHTKVAPTEVAEPQWIAWNTEFAKNLILPAALQDTHSALPLLAGTEVLAEFEPYAAAYAGHQFGHFNPRLGDGRAITIAEAQDKDGQHWEIQLKGAGRTPFSRGGDGRSPLGPVLREYLVSESMAALDIPTTRALAAVATGEWVYREQAEPGAILTRVARSHVRVGTFQFASVHGGEPQVKALTHWLIDSYFPELKDTPYPAVALLDTVVTRQAKLIAKWMQVGFIHGVMNTDNMSILGDTIDYGPCAFMDSFKRDQVYSYIDKNGRYRFERQPIIGQWNLSRLAESLLTLHIPARGDTELAVNDMKQIVQQFLPRYEQFYYQGMLAKLGLGNPEQVINAEDKAWVEAMLSLAEAQSVDYTRLFLHLEYWLDTHQIHSELGDKAAWEPWLHEWSERLNRLGRTRTEAIQQMQTVNPTLIPRNHLVAEAITEAEQQGDLAVFHDLLLQLQKPFDRAALEHRFARPPKPQEQIGNTFCGT